MMHRITEMPAWERLFKRIVWAQIGDLKGLSILDFGSGEGITADHYAENNSVTAVEPSEEMLSSAWKDHEYKQIIGDVSALSEFADHTFDFIICHNVLEYIDDKQRTVNELARVLKQDGRLSIVKHNRNGRIMQMVVLLNNFDQANNLLDGQNSNAQQFGTIKYYDDSDISNWCRGLVLQQTYGLRTFWDLQQNQEIQKDEEWQKKMINIEMRVSQNPDFQRISFFHHLIFEKR